MVTQKSIHLKLQENLLAALDQYCDSTWKSRNRIINEAIRDYINLKKPGLFTGDIEYGRYRW